ncbi:hypothetical protein [Actinokineospora diospyrosa]|uniref:Uncharacterized protein n=1 Tax=Actinokineospora diospyrosa TaxID=103728 RepID=A0ABT1I9Z3_9PSEU|nr:hypothetical protein [Actinokineospora diospyrosa]MCP2269361.1 hypothetical protein [Actinokineospora diospyrosa]
MAERALLLGFGADIGSNLIARNDPDRDGFLIGDVVTHAVRPGPGVTALGQLVARMLLADPAMLGRVEPVEGEQALLVDGRLVRVHFLDAEDPEVLALGRFGLAIVATTRVHVRDAALMGRFRQVAKHVVGVAENAGLPGFYAPLAGADLSRIGRVPRPFDPEGGVYALGSCQCVGWAVPLRGLLEAAVLAGVDDLGLVRVEVEIVHPDTASSRFGTAGVGARAEDARDNLRPGHSQLSASMARLAPVSSVNTVSLRVLTQPPGYQVCRFFVRAPLDHETVRAGMLAAAAALPGVIGTTDVAIGSRAFSLSPAAATVLTTPQHLLVTRDPFPGSGIVEVITQSFVHNTTGYCGAVLDAGARLLGRGPVTLL